MKENKKSIDKDSIIKMYSDLKKIETKQEESYIVIKKHEEDKSVIKENDGK